VIIRNMVVSDYLILSFFVADTLLSAFFMFFIIFFI
jgi:hypothetical protein